MIKVVPAKELSLKQKTQLLKMLEPSWESPEQVLEVWHPDIDTYLFIMNGKKIEAVGSWKIHKVENKKFPIGIKMVLFAVSKEAQGKGYGTKITLLSFLHSFKEARKKYGSHKMLYWGLSANPIVINSYLKHFPFYITPRLDNSYNKDYESVATSIVKYIGKEHLVPPQNPFLIKKCVQHNFTKKEVDIQNSYIKKLGENFRLDLDIANNDRVLLILGAFKSKIDYLKLYLLYQYLNIRTQLKKLFKFK
ncbi:MAG: hypothetical protein MK008_05270 [Bdellovibrionales bacterium]|nr:hypothetical protein [Bdellovibrionales bacterium]